MNTVLIGVQTHSDVQSLELKIPPLALVIIAAVLMWVAGSFFPQFNFRFPFRSALAGVCGVAGVAICGRGIVAFKRANTTVNPTKPGSASALVRTGIYRRTRNPMYLGFVLILAGWAFLNSNVLAFLVLPGFVFYMNRFQIEPEERALASLFGDDFRAYCSEARRWI